MLDAIGKNLLAMFSTMFPLSKEITGIIVSSNLAAWKQAVHEINAKEISLMVPRKAIVMFLEIPADATFQGKMENNKICHLVISLFVFSLLSPSLIPSSHFLLILPGKDATYNSSVRIATPK